MSGKITGENIEESESTHSASTENTANLSRKRNFTHGSANISSKDASVSESKIRKVSRGGAAASCSTTSVNTPSSASSSASTSTRVPSALRFLTDFYPDQTVESGPLTRSKTRNVDTSRRAVGSSAASSSTARASTRTSKKTRRNPSNNFAAPPAVEFSISTQEPRSPTPDPSSSNLTVAGSDASGFSLASSFGSDSQNIGAELETVTLRAIGLNSQSVTNFGLLNTMPATSRNDGLNSSGGNTSQPFLSRSQHVQRASHFLGSFVPRMQHLLGGNVGPSSSTNTSSSFAPNPSEYLPHMRVLNLIEELRSDNEIRQSEACAELSEMLLLGNEESLPNFPIRELMLCLISLLNKDHNFELMLSASHCITNLQEALPRSHTILVEAIPILLQKLKHIEYIDVAEQALVILNVISRRNAKNILASSGIQLVTSHVDFFSMPTQRLAFQIAANCATYVTNSDFHMVQDSIPDLIQRVNTDDKRCVESVCMFFNRLIENMRYYPNRLRQIAGKNHTLLVNFQQVLMIQPPPVSSGTFISLIKSLRYMCTSCGDLSVALFSLDFSKTLRYLLIGSEKKLDQPAIDATIRPTQQLREIVDLIGELLPRLPNIGVFEINTYLEQYTNPMSFIQNSRHRMHNTANWFYRVTPEPDPADLATWKAFPTTDQMTLERNHSMGVGSMTLEVDGQLCEINFSSMTRRIIATGLSYQVDRRPINASANDRDERNLSLERNFEPFLEFATTIFPLLVDIGSNSTCGNLRYDCVRVMIRMLYAVRDNSQLSTFLKDVPLAAYISSTLSSSKNVALVALAVQLSNVLLEKLPDLYVPLFESEGVFFELKQKAMNLPLKKTHSKSCIKSLSSSRLQTSSSTTAALDRHKSHSQIENTQNANTALETSTAATLSRLLQHQMFQSTSTNNSETLHQLASVANASPSNSGATSVSPSALRYAPPTQTFSLDPFSNRSVLPNLFLSTSSIQNPTSSLYQTLSNAVSQSYTQNAYNLNIGSLTNHIDAVASSITNSHSSLNGNASSLKSSAVEKLEAFIQNESLNLTSNYVNESAQSDDLSSMKNLVGIAETLVNESEDTGLKPLQDLRDVLLTCELTAFQINYSGIIASLIVYLTDKSDKLKPSYIDRIQRFTLVFMLVNDNVRPTGDDSTFPAFSGLINKVILAVERLEQFNVRITNLANLPSLSSTSGSSSQSPSNSTTYLRGAQALRFFQSHQIRCNLRRHSSCKVLRDWRRGRGSIKVDPFTSISAIERYLIDRGIGTSQEESSENEEISDDEKETNSLITNFKGRIEILIGDSPLPSDISIIQAIQQYALPQDDDQETISQSIFVSGHTLYYRGVMNDDEGPSTSGLSSNKTLSTTTDITRTLSPIRKLKSSRLKKVKSTEKRLKDDKKASTNESGSKTAIKMSNLERYLTTYLEHSIDGDPSESGLVLLKILYGINTYWWQLFEDEHALPSTHLPILTQGCFHSAKLNSKVTRQLSDFLTVATQQIPKWTKNLVRAVPFIFPFITRRNFLYCTAFGRDRALMHLVNETNPDDHENESNSRLVPRLERRKITINRSTLLKDAQQAMMQLGSSRPLLEVSFDGEVGTGFGPTMEFYSTLSREIQKHSNRLWQGTALANSEDGETVEYTVGETGLYPVITRQQNTSRSWDSRTKRFEFIGRLMAQTILDSRILDIPFASPFFKWILGEQDELGLPELEKLEPTIYNSLRRIGKLSPKDIENIDMNFTYPGNDLLELVKGGKNRTLVYDNYRQFVDLICQWRLIEGVKSDMQSVQRGFQQVINIDHLAIFDADEMEGLFCGCADSDDSIWSRAILQQTIRPDHGYTQDSIQITWLIDMLVSFSLEERRKFLQFVTGSPRLPVGGLRQLHPPLTVVRKIASYGCAETELPSVATCYNYLKIPDYETYEIFCERFRVALQHIYSFHMT